MLNLPIVKCWFDMCLSGIKKDEYRTYGKYWAQRFADAIRRTKVLLPGLPENCFFVRYVNGYGNSRPSFVALVQLDEGIGLPEWGAPLDEKVFILHLLYIEAEKGKVCRVPDRYPVRIKQMRIQAKGK